jgi:methanogenic corrinoid protein MtbC1
VTAWTDRARIAALLQRDRDVLASRTTNAFFARHPDWNGRFGDRGWVRCHDDALHHLGYLAGAVYAGAPHLYAEYASWVVALLEARGMEAAHVTEYLELLGAVAAGALPDPGPELVLEITEDALAASRAPRAAELHAPVPLDAVRSRFLLDALAGDRRAAIDGVRAALSAGASLRDVYEQVFERAQRELGDLWAQDRITVADEHVASAITLAAATSLAREIPAPTRGVALLTGPEGELHQMGLTFVADLLELDGWRVRLVGTNTPRSAVIAAVERHRPDVVGISATLASNLPAAAELARAVRELPAPPTLVVGGRAFRGHDLAAELGAAGAATDLAGARRLFASL